ncbi:carcinoembryonic antigen-related cell adhesion molecule 2-like [Dendropsophus ebraccatus]|uniref:carcinoembryonic antigen-related cell adhesion molecule 2-like n=1 Tax=Dendropsophus ebraccatus TaxID=150705 RepID=UPI0038321294
MTPSVTFTPIWNKILNGDSVTMSCDVDVAVEGNVAWYRNYERIHTGGAYTIQSAQSSDSGDYWCGTSEEDISEAVTLSVVHGPLVLQSPPYIHEGEDLSLRCHSGSMDYQGPIEFYRNNELIHSSASDSVFLVGDHRDETAVYRCTKQFLTGGYSIYSDETNISDQGAAAPIRVTFTPNWRKILTGDDVTIRCDSYRYKSYYWCRDNTLLMDADQDFIDIRSAQRSDSGTYQCGTWSSKSPGVRLDVSDGPVILQAPLHVSGVLRLRCRSRPEYSVDWTRFYKGDKLLQDSGDVLFLTQAQVAGRYRCEKRLYRDPVSYTDSVSVPIRENDGHGHLSYLHLTVSVALLIILIVSAILIFRLRHQITRLFPKRNRTRDPQPDLTEGDDICYITLSLPTKATSQEVTETVVYSAVRIKDRES